jgi:hypothetical protein
MKTKAGLAVILSLMLALPALVLAGDYDAEVRAVHASPDAGPVDVLANDTIVLYSGVPFKGIGEYLTVDPELYNIKVVPAGGMPSDAVIDENVNLYYETTTTIVAINEVASIEPLVLTDNNSMVPQGKVRARFVHASPDTFPVDIKIVGGPIVFSNVAFGEASEYMMFPAGTVDLEIREAGDDAPALILYDITFEERSVYTIFAFDFLANLDVVLNQDATFDDDDEDSDDESADDDWEDDDSSDDDDSGWGSFWERWRNRG